MKFNNYFKPTSLCREYIILDSIDKNKNITQRELSENAGTSVSLINLQIKKFIKNKIVKAVYFRLKLFSINLLKKVMKEKKY